MLQVDWSSFSRQCRAHSHWWSPLNSLLEVIQVGMKVTWTRIDCWNVVYSNVGTLIVYCFTTQAHIWVHSGHGSHQTSASHGYHCYCNTAVQQHITEFLGRPECAIGSMNQPNITYSVYNLTSSKGTKGTVYAQTFLGCLNGVMRFMPCVLLF